MRFLFFLSILMILGGSGPALCQLTPEKPLGQTVYDTHCAVCHGLQGDGKGEVAAQFFTKPRDFTKGEYKIKSTPSGSIPTDADLIRSVKHGIPGTAMVPQDYLSDAEVQTVVEYIKGFSRRFSQAISRKSIVIPSPPSRTPERVARGQAAYEKADCAQCHGQNGKGDGPSAKDLSIKPADLTQRPLKNGPAVHDIFRTILTGFDGTPMPAYQFILEDEEVWDLAYYIESLGRPNQQTADEQKGRTITEEYSKKQKKD